jgi:putative transcriptional regulator
VNTALKLTLKAARVNAGLTQTKAAEIIGVTPDTIGNWERGKYLPNTIMISRIEKAYGVSYNDLIFLPKKFS